MKNLGEYHDLYVQRDTLLSADVFENVRDKCIEIYGLDPAHFLSAPGLAWQACLKKSKVNILICYWWFKKGLEAEFLKNYNKDIVSSYLMYLDPGYFLEVDIDYLKELFNLHKDLPFLPERKKVNKCEKLICSIEDKEKYVVHIRALKQALNHGLILKKGTQSN